MTSFKNLKRVSQILKTGLKNPGLRVNVRNAKHQNRPTQVMVKIDAL